MPQSSSRRIACAVLAGAAVIAGSSTAYAQSDEWQDKGFVNVNVGVQARPDTFTETSSPVIYGEPGAIVVPVALGRSPLFDVSAGMRVWENLGLSAGYSRLSRTATPTVTAVVPNPVLVNQPRTASAAVGELAHTESVVHLSMLWMFPFSPKFDVAAVVGASIFTVSQDFVAGVTPTEGAPPFSTVSIASARTASASNTAPALTIGADATYRVTRRFGAGLFVRYSRLNGGRINIDDPSGGSTIAASAGGMQAGLGLRARF
jgi:hypothetical protein